MVFVVFSDNRGSGSHQQKLMFVADAIPEMANQRETSKRLALRLSMSVRAKGGSTPPEALVNKNVLTALPRQDFRFRQACVLTGEKDHGRPREAYQDSARETSPGRGRDEVGMPGGHLPRWQNADQNLCLYAGDYDSCSLVITPGLVKCKRDPADIRIALETRRAGGVWFLSESEIAGSA